MSHGASELVRKWVTSQDTINDGSQIITELTQLLDRGFP